MDLKSTIGIILKDLKEARDIMDDLKNYPDVPEIQIELAKAKCRSAEEVLKFLSDKDFSLRGKENNIINSAASDIPEPDNEIIPDRDIIDVSEISYFKKNDDAPEENKESADSKDDNLSLIDEIVQPSDKPETETRKDVKDQKRKIMADKFTQQSSINERIAHKRHDSESAEAGKHKPVNNLTEAIGINDRFQFVRELFNGNHDLYTSTIEELNNAATIDEAFDILTVASKSNKESETFDLMLDLVKRKLRNK